VTGTLVNTATVLAGGMLGTVLSSAFPARIRETLITGMSLVVVAMGVKMAMETSSILIVPGSITIGGIAGELLHLQRRFDAAGMWLEQVLSRYPVFTRGNFSQILSDQMVSELTATGGVIMLGIAVHMLELKKIRLANFLPALLAAPLIVLISGIIHR
jgi:uncharacterized membrane protein YqgA involved in biofilm formation